MGYFWPWLQNLAQMSLIQIEELKSKNKTFIILFTCWPKRQLNWLVKWRRISVFCAGICNISASDSAVNVGSKTIKAPCKPENTKLAENKCAENNYKFILIFYV
jgi:hypothetical protein